MRLLATALQETFKGVRGLFPQSAGYFGQFVRDHAVAFQRHFQRFAIVGPKIRFLHTGIPFDKTRKGRFLAALQHKSVLRAFQPEKPLADDYPGIFGKPCRPGMVAQGSALSQYICMAGLNGLGSSNVPIVTMMTPAMMSAVSVTVEPQVGQNARWVGFPLSPTLSKFVVSPVTVNEAVGIATTEAKAVPVTFWHEVQWQMPTNTGSAEAE